MTPEELRRIHTEFRETYPGVEGLNIRQMRDVLAGKLHMVKISGTRKFTLMSAADVQPGGKLDQMNAETRRRNAETRQRNREQEERLLIQLRDILRF